MGGLQPHLLRSAAYMLGYNVNEAKNPVTT